MTGARIDHCMRRLNELFVPIEAKSWMLASQPLLLDQIPAEMIRAGKGAEVLRAIDQLADGVYL